MLIADNGIFDFFSHSTWIVIRNLTSFFVAVFWLSIGFWVFKDARRRIEDTTQLFGMSQIVLALIFILIIIFRREGLMGQREVPLDRLFLRRGRGKAAVDGEPARGAELDPPQSE